MDFIFGLFLVCFVLFFVGWIGYYILQIYANNKVKRRNEEAKNQFQSQGYTITRQIGTLCIDENNKKWFYPGINAIFDYSDIIDFEIVEDGTSYKSKNGVLRAVVGGATFGLVGALVGASTAKQVSTVQKMDLLITTRKEKFPQLTIHFISTPTQTNSMAYIDTCTLARQMVAQLTVMRDKVENPQYSEKSSINEFSTYTKVVGVTKNNDEGQPIQPILATLSPSDSLTFVREPSNPYDSNAIKVICEYQHIGYIKANLAKDIAPLMDSGKQLKGNISEITGGEDGLNYGCNIYIQI